MRNTLITKNIDGHEIVCGLGRAVIDPVKLKAWTRREIPKTSEYKTYFKLQKTHQKIMISLSGKVHKKRLAMQSDKISMAIHGSDEYKNFERIKALADKTAAGIKLFTEAWNVYKAKEKQICTSDSNVNAVLLETDEYKEWLLASRTANDEIKKAHCDVLNKRREIVESSSIFFTPKAGEEIITDEDALSTKVRLEELPEKSFLTKSGDVVEDRRLEVFMYQDEYTGEWTQGTITALGEEMPPTGVFQKEMSNELQKTIFEQKEELRIDALSAEDRQTEFDQRLQGNQHEGVFIRSEKELLGMDSAQALAEAQAWLAERKVELLEKYGIAEET